MSFHLIIVEDDRGDEHPIAVAGATSYEQAGTKAHRYAYDVLHLNVEGYADGGQVDSVTSGMTAIQADPTTDRNRFDAFGNPR